MLSNYVKQGLVSLWVPKSAREQANASFGSAGHQSRCESDDASALHERRELVEVFQDQRDVFLELNGLGGLERRLELLQVVFLVRILDALVGLERCDFLPD